MCAPNRTKYPRAKQNKKKKEYLMKLDDIVLEYNDLLPVTNRNQLHLSLKYTATPLILAIWDGQLLTCSIY